MNPQRLDGFDCIAPVYDAMATLVFGGNIKKAQLCYLNEIRKGDRVLIIGGGTGWLLAEVLRTNPGCEIWYIEASSKMISIAKSNISKLPNTCVHFIHGTQAQIPLHLMYEVVIANFYFDLFSASTLENLIDQIRNLIMPNGKLLVSDFTTNNSWWQSALLSLMYMFFRWTCKIEATGLPDWERQLNNSELEQKASKGFYGRFIRSSVFENCRGVNPAKQDRSGPYFFDSGNFVTGMLI